MLAAMLKHVNSPLWDPAFRVSLNDINYLLKIKNKEIVTYASSGPGV